MESDIIRININKKNDYKYIYYLYIQMIELYMNLPDEEIPQLVREKGRTDLDSIF